MIRFIGAGSVNRVLASRLRSQAVDLQWIVRDPSVVRSRVAEISSTEKVFSWNETGVAAPIEPAIYVVGCKTGELDQVHQSLSKIITSQDRVVWVQNGLGIWEKIENWLAMLSAEQRAFSVTRLACWFGARDGKLLGDYRMVASVQGESETDWLKHFPIAQMGDELSFESSAVLLEWRKAFLNLAVNGIATRDRLLNGGILERPEVLAEAKELILESVAVAQAQFARRGQTFTWTPDEVWTQVLMGMERSKPNRCSTLLDFEAGRVTEFGTMNPQIVQWGSELSIATPKNALLCQKLSSLGVRW